MRSHAYSVSADRFGDVLELLLAAILEANVQLAFDFAVDLARDQDTTRIGNAFKSSRDVDPVTINIALLVNDHVAQIDADPQLKGALVRPEVFLNFQPALYGSKRTGKFREDAVSGRLNEATPMAAEARLDHLPPEPPDLRIGRLLGTFHKSGIADHIGRQ